MNGDLDWILLAYTLPGEPSRLRVAVWRRLRKLGAAYLNEGIWFLPNREDLAKAVRRVVADVEGHGGTASAFLARGMQENQSARLQARFNQARDEEYAEVRRQCERFLAHVQQATEAENFAFTELEELEQDLEKRKRWLAEIMGRDVFGSSERQPVEGLLEQCKEVLARFTEQAFERAR